MSLVKKYPILGSSQDSNKLSLTVKGILVALVPIIIAIGQSQGWSITQGDLMDIIEAITAIVAAGSVIYGVFRKFKK